MAQELLTTFADDLQGVLLKPSEVSGRYTICIGEQKVFDLKEVEQLVRDVVAPGKSLGHADRKGHD
jgi:selenoprotein W-related protein